MDIERRNQLAVRTVVVSYQAALRHAGRRDRELLRSRAMAILDQTAVRMEPDGSPQLRRQLADARRTISAR